MPPPYIQTDAECARKIRNAPRVTRLALILERMLDSFTLHSDLRVVRWVSVR